MIPRSGQEPSLRHLTPKGETVSRSCSEYSQAAWPRVPRTCQGAPSTPAHVPVSQCHTPQMGGAAASNADQSGGAVQKRPPRATENRDIDAEYRNFGSRTGHQGIGDGCRIALRRDRYEIGKGNADHEIVKRQGVAGRVAAYFEINVTLTSDRVRRDRSPGHLVRSQGGDT